MELFGYLSFVGDLQEIPTTNSQYGSDYFYVREVCIHTFVTNASNGECIPYARGYTLRLTGRQAQTFCLEPATLVAVEASSSARPYFDERDKKRRVNGNLTISRICAIQQTDLDSLYALISAYGNVGKGSAPTL